MIGFLPGTPTPGYRVHKGGASGASALRCGINFIKQKFQGAPDLVEGHLSGPQNQIWKDLGPHVLLEQWSLILKDSL